MSLTEQFQYFISEKNGFLVASLIGVLENDCLEKLQELSAEIVNADFKKLVLNFRDVVGVSPEMIPILARLQKTVREKEADLRLCGLKPEVKERMSRAGILRPHELTDNLQTALVSMMTSSKRAS